MQEHCLQHIASMHRRVIELQTALTAFCALGPEYGGSGETSKAAYLETCLQACGATEITHVDSPDKRVPAGVRPNIIARIPGKTSRTLWLFGHMDVVPAGDLDRWSSAPWQVRIDGDKLIGRGVEDNQQAIVSALLVAEALHAEKIIPELSLGIVCMADEECGNTHGLDYILKTRPDFFHTDDLFIVPDSGSPEGNKIEIAEKSVLWLKFSLTGEQTHASTPQKGSNAFLAGADLALELSTLAEEFNEQDELFSPPYSTFVPTRHDANIPNINTVPGTDNFYMDCRLLPGITLESVRAAVRRRCDIVSARRHVQIQEDIVQWLPSTPKVPLDSVILSRLRQAIQSVYHVAPHPVGIGGSTVACLLRKCGLPAVVWSRLLNTCHEPNETSLISSAIGDAQVFATILFES